MGDRKFGVQVKVWNPRTQSYEWFWCHPVGGPRYEYSTGEEAHRMKEDCYPLSSIDFVRVAEILEDQ